MGLGCDARHRVTLGDVGGDLPRGGYVSIAADNVALAAADDAAAEQRVRVFRVDLEGGVEVGARFVQPVEFEVDEAAGEDGRSEVRPLAYRLVAIGQRLYAGKTALATLAV